jgi:hypothetical protein
MRKRTCANYIICAGLGLSERWLYMAIAIQIQKKEQRIFGNGFTLSLASLLYG